MRPLRRAPALVALCWCAVTAPTAEAQAQAEDTKARAEELFKRGLDDMLTGHYESGCPTLAESYRLDPLPGALFTLAECEAKWGRLASAYDHYQEFVARYEQMEPGRKAKQRQRAEVAKKQLDELAPDIPTLTIELVSGAPAKTVVKRDGAIVPRASLGTPLRIDPGRHTVTAQALDQEPRTYEVSLNRGEEQTLRVDPSPEASDEAWAVDGDAMRTAAIVAFALGAAGGIVGTTAGLVTLVRKGTIEDNCDGTACNREGTDAADQARVSGAVSTVGIVVGGVGLALGLTLWLTAPHAGVTDDPSGGDAGDTATRRGPRWALSGTVDPLSGQGSLAFVLDW